MSANKEKIAAMLDRSITELYGVDPATKIAEMKKIFGLNLNRPLVTLSLLLPYILSEIQFVPGEIRNGILNMNFKPGEQVEKDNASKIEDDYEFIEKLKLLVGQQINSLSGVDPAIKMAEMAKIVDAYSGNPDTIILLLMPFILSKP